MLKWIKSKYEDWKKEAIMADIVYVIGIIIPAILIMWALVFAFIYKVFIE